jgi:FkbM family methyltransferase
MFEHLRTGDDIRSGRPARAILIRTIKQCVRDMHTAYRRAAGASKVLAPIWVMFFYLGMATRPMHSPRTLSLRMRRGQSSTTTVVRRNQSDLYVWKEVFLDGAYEFPYEDYLERIDVIIDVGANAGLAASFLATRFPEARMICVEPVVENHAVIACNADALGATWESYAVAIGAARGEADIFASEWWCSATLVAEIANRRSAAPNGLEGRLGLPVRTVPVAPMAEFLADARVEHVSILKMDIEGAEAEVITNDARWLRRVGLLVVELHERFIDTRPILEVLDRFGFEQVAARGAVRTFVNRHPMRS